MGKFKFCHISDKYIAYLHSIDNRVQLNKGEHRPYVGIVLKVQGADYYVPLESPKPNHAKIKNGGPVLKMDDGKLGIMGFNNMIPVGKDCLLDFEIREVADEKYRMLLYNQVRYCEKHWDLILRRAETVYRKAVERNVPLYSRVCCDFKKLERKSKNYDPAYRPKKKIK